MYTATAGIAETSHDNPNLIKLGNCSKIYGLSTSFERDSIRCAVNSVAQTSTWLDCCISCP